MLLGTFALPGITVNTRGSLFGMPDRKEVCRFDSLCKPCLGSLFGMPERKGMVSAIAQRNAQAMYRPYSASIAAFARAEMAARRIPTVDSWLRFRPDASGFHRGRSFQNGSVFLFVRWCFR